MQFKSSSPLTVCQVFNHGKISTFIKGRPTSPLRKSIHQEVISARVPPRRHLGCRLPLFTHPRLRRRRRGWPLSAHARGPSQFAFRHPRAPGVVVKKQAPMEKPQQQKARILVAARGGAAWGLPTAGHPGNRGKKIEVGSAITKRYRGSQHLTVHAIRNHWL